MSKLYTPREAWYLVKCAISRGEIVKPFECEKCSKTCRKGRFSGLHAHHDDYTQPLCVRFLCPSCHATLHGKRGLQSIYLEQRLKKIDNLE